jgi:hypothetical protein
LKVAFEGLLWRRPSGYCKLSADNANVSVAVKVKWRGRDQRVEWVPAAERTGQRGAKFSTKKFSRDATSPTPNRREVTLMR